MSKINDLNMENWKEYDDIISDSLWLINSRDKSGTHKGDYHGNFIPQIPYQMMRRYTKQGDWILDPFVGSGTSLIEAQKLDRNGIGIDIDGEVIKEADHRLSEKYNDSIQSLYNGDSRTLDVDRIIYENKIDGVDFIFYHPPYWDIVKFNDIEGNLSLSNTLDEYLENFEKVFDNTIKHLHQDRYFCVVIGDIYKNSKWVPLHSYLMDLVSKKGHTLKSIVVKNMGETSAKSGQKSLWRYRSLRNGYYVFAHEYILIFKK